MHRLVTRKVKSLIWGLGIVAVCAGSMVGFVNKARSRQRLTVIAQTAKLVEVLLGERWSNWSSIDASPTSLSALGRCGEKLEVLVRWHSGRCQIYKFDLRDNLGLDMTKATTAELTGAALDSAISKVQDAATLMGIAAPKEATVTAGGYRVEAPTKGICVWGTFNAGLVKLTILDSPRRYAIATASLYNLSP